MRCVVLVVLVVPCSESGSACWLRYLFHLEFLFSKCNKRKSKKIETERENEKEKEKGKERKRTRKKNKGKERKTKRERERGRGRGRGTEREKEEEDDKEKEICKKILFLLLAPESALEKFAAIVKPENKPTKVNWALSWPSALDICGRTVL